MSKVNQFAISSILIPRLSAAVDLATGKSTRLGMASDFWTPEP